MNKFCNDINSKTYYGLVLELPKNDERHEKFQKQRLERGFDDTELWSLDSTFAKFFAPRLKQYYEVACDIHQDKKYCEEIKQLVEFFESYEVPLFGEKAKHVEKMLKLFAKHFMGLWY